MDNHVNQLIIEEIGKLGAGIDIQKIITKVFPGELHLRDWDKNGKFKKASFCGPGTNLKKRLANYAEAAKGEKPIPEDWSKPISKLDAACMQHDADYLQHKDKKNRHDADRALINAADAIIKDKRIPAKNRAVAKIVKGLMSAKVKFGLGIGGQIDCLCDELGLN